MKQLNCKGLACPQPVMRCRAALNESQSEALEIIVDNQAAAVNVENFLRAREWSVENVAVGPSEWKLLAAPTPKGAEGLGQPRIAPDLTPASPALESASGLDNASSGVLRPGQSGKTVVFITTEFLGLGDDSLGGKLMLNFLSTLPEMGAELWKVILVNGGVKLSAAEPYLSKLRELAKAGVGILVCGTCLDHYGLLENKAVGDTTNMLDIVTSLQLADKVIHI